MVAGVFLKQTFVGDAQHLKMQHNSLILIQRERPQTRTTFVITCRARTNTKKHAILVVATC